MQHTLYINTTKAKKGIGRACSPYARCPMRSLCLLSRIITSLIYPYPMTYRIGHFYTKKKDKSAMSPVFSYYYNDAVVWFAYVFQSGS